MGTSERSARGSDRGVVRVLVGLLEHHGTITIAVRGAQQARHERMGEERTADLIRFLGVFGGGCCSEERHSLATQLCLSDLEGCHDAPALRPGQFACPTSVHDQQAKLGCGATHQLRELSEL